MRAATSNSPAVDGSSAASSTSSAARASTSSLALEDDPRNHEMYVDEGVPCLYVHSGYYD